MESDDIAQLRTLIDAKQYDKAVEQIDHVEMDETNRKKAKFLILRDHYISQIEQGNYEQALQTLRVEIKNNCSDQNILHKLAGLILCKDKEHLDRKLVELGIRMKDDQLIDDIYEQCEPDRMLEPNRLNKLIEQSWHNQIQNCKYHRVDMEIEQNLLEDHVCDEIEICQHELQVINDNKDEVWLVQFSHDGRFLVCACKDNSVTVYAVDKQYKYMKYDKKQNVHQKEINQIQWYQNDDEYLFATASNDMTVKVWMIKQDDGLVMVNQTVWNMYIFAVTFRTRHQLYVGGIEDVIYKVDIENEEQIDNKIEQKIQWKRISDLQFNKDINMLIAVSTTSNQIALIKNEQIVNTIQEKDIIVSTICRKKYLLVNTSYQCPEIHLYDTTRIENGELPIINRFQGHHQQKFLIRCDLGGFNQQFVICGGEDGRIMQWNMRDSTQLTIINGHSQSVNQVAQNPNDNRMFVSCSDDNLIKIWGTKQLKDQITKKSDKSHILTNFAVFFKNYLQGKDDEHMQLGNINEMEQQNSSEQLNRNYSLTLVDQNSESENSQN